MLLSHLRYARLQRADESPNTLGWSSISAGTEAQVLAQGGAHDFGGSATRLAPRTLKRRCQLGRKTYRKL